MVRQEEESSVWSFCVPSKYGWREEGRKEKISKGDDEENISM